MDDVEGMKLERFGRMREFVLSDGLLREKDSAAFIVVSSENEADHRHQPAIPGLSAAEVVLGS